MINSRVRQPGDVDPIRTAPPLGPRYARPQAPQLSTARAAVLRALGDVDDAVTVSTLATQLGQHPNTVREHLDALLADGRIERERSAPTGRGRPAWLYRAAAGETTLSEAGLASGHFSNDGEEYAALAVALIDQVASGSPDPGAMARQAGERWGRSLAEQYAAEQDEAGPSTAVTRVLTDLRFESRLDDGNHPGREHTGRDAASGGTNGPTKTVHLTTCPFLDAARRSPDVVCQVHLGIVRGALERLGGDPDSADLTAFAEPGACLLTLPAAPWATPNRPGTR